jgi:NAD(P)-dependent dehydrogenase (short-subunit alcohol dehydrogenase family)
LEPVISRTINSTGLGFVKSLVKRDDAIVFAGARTPAAAKELQDLATQFPDKLHIVKLESGSEKDSRAAVEQVKRIAGRLDVVIANAGEKHPMHSNDTDLSYLL